MLHIYKSYTNERINGEVVQPVWPYFLCWQENYNFIDNIGLEWVYFNLAKISIKQKAMQKSKIYLEKALEIKPDFKQALLLKKEIK